jgi:TolB-like protein/DNA-binding winged helix-turn-helix (wHTH) protein/Tfp pilus assembly protein PilF
MAARKPGAIRFGVFELDPKAGELRKGGTRLKLQQQPFQVLTVLIEHAGDLVTKEALRQRLWPSDTFVGFDHGLHSAITRLREALGDSAESPRFIETVPRLGYRFVASVEPIGGPADEESHRGSGGAPDPGPWRRLRSVGDEHCGRPAFRAAWHRAAVLSLALGLVVVAFIIWRTSSPGVKPTIAVLPFLNLSSDPDNAYFSDGLADQITGLLSLTDGLDVTARTSSFALKGKQLDAREIGARLNATVLVEGSVQKSSDRMKVIVQIIRAADGKHLWSNTYDREMRDVFATEEGIAASIVSALRLKLGARRRYTENPVAFELYLRGRYAFDHRPARLALQYFEQAADNDPSYAPAYAGIANAVLVMQMNHQLPYDDAHRRAAAAVERAFHLDPSLAEAYTALGEIKTWDYAWPEAEQAFRRAIELNPNDARAHEDLGFYLLAPLGRSKDAVREVRRAQALDPLSIETNESETLTMIMAGLYGDAEESARKVLLLEPTGFLPRLHLARALSFQGKPAEAMDAIHLAERLALRGDQDWHLACVTVRAGRRDEAIQTLNHNLADPRPALNRRLFMIYACLGEKDRALEYAEKMYAEHEPLLPTFLTYPETALLRGDPGFAALRQRIGLPK